MTVAAEVVVVSVEVKTNTTTVRSKIARAKMKGYFLSLKRSIG